MQTLDTTSPDLNNYSTTKCGAWGVNVQCIMIPVSLGDVVVDGQVVRLLLEVG